jgi:hypothetical protein
VIELHGIKYYSPEDISKNFPVTLEFVIQKIESEELDCCIINEKVYVCEDDVLRFFTENH